MKHLCRERNANGSGLPESHERVVGAAAEMVPAARISERGMGSINEAFRNNNLNRDALVCLKYT